MSERTQFLVYLLVDEQNRIHYVGRGTHDRAMAHSEFDGNDQIAAAYRDGKLRSLVLDCETKQAMEVAEGALIDALMRFKPATRLANRRLDKYSFMPSRVPAEFADRQQCEVLDPMAVAEQVQGSVLYVIVNEGAINHDGRGVIDPLRPCPAAIADRIESSWWLDPWITEWNKHPESAPKAIIGLAGSKHDRYILGALDLAGAAWPKAVGRRGAFHLAPWAKLGRNDEVVSEDIDAYELCGRRMTGVDFGRSTALHVRVYDSAGVIVPRP